MRLSISNIAWDPRLDDAIAGLLRRYHVDAIDVAPGKYFPRPVEATPEDIHRVRSWWGERGIEIAGMQALLFGTTGLNLFGAREVQVAMLAHLDAVCRIAAGLGSSRLVFGSPKNRDRLALSDADAAETAIGFFRRLGDVAARHGVTICLEPNPARYGCNFMTTTDEAAGIVRAVRHDAIRMQLDTGAMAINGEDPGQMVERYVNLIGHVHASEPDLVPLGDGGTDHARVALALSAHTQIDLVTIEMLETRKEDPLVAIERALQVADRSYRRRNTASAMAS